MTIADIERLRELLLDYYGTGQGAFPFFVAGLGSISGASKSKLIQMAKELEAEGVIDLSGFDLDEDDLER